MMSDLKLTEASIQENKHRDNLNIDISLLKNPPSKEYPYFLIVQSYMDKCIRISIYPIEKEVIIRIYLSGSSISSNSTAKLLQDFKIIHSTGFLFKGEDFHYECYLDLGPSDSKIKDLKASLDKIRNIFKVVKIEEIESKTNQVKQ